MSSDLKYSESCFPILQNSMQLNGLNSEYLPIYDEYNISARKKYNSKTMHLRGIILLSTSRIFNQLAILPVCAYF